VAIGADDSAFLKLSFKGADRGSNADHVGDVSAFLLEMVKLENVGMRLAAIHTLLGSQVVGNEGATILSPKLPR
jgi:hypothetical protein